MNVLDVFRGAGYIGQITAGAVLAAFGLSGRAAGIHEEERCFRRHLYGLDPAAVIFFQQVVDKEIATFHHRGLQSICRDTLPDQDLFDLLSVFGRLGHGNIRLFLVLLNLTGPRVGVHRDQVFTPGVDDPVGAGPGAEPAEDLGMNTPSLAQASIVMGSSATMGRCRVTRSRPSGRIHSEGWPQTHSPGHTTPGR